MSKHLKLFETQAEYDNFITTSDFILPNVSHCLDNKHVYYNPETKTTPPPNNEVNDDGSFLGKDGITYKTMNFDVTSHIVWLDRSLGATSPKELGIEYDLNMSVSDVEKMIKQKLGDKWRLPTDDELLKLFKYFETQEFTPLNKFKDNEGYRGNAIETFKLKDKNFILKTLKRGYVTSNQPLDDSYKLDSYGRIKPEYANKPINYMPEITYTNNLNNVFLTKNGNNVYYKIEYKSDNYGNFNTPARLINVMLAGTPAQGTTDNLLKIYFLPVKDVN